MNFKLLILAIFIGGGPFGAYADIHFEETADWQRIESDMAGLNPLLDGQTREMLTCLGLLQILSFDNADRGSHRGNQGPQTSSSQADLPVMIDCNEQTEEMVAGFWAMLDGQRVEVRRPGLFVGAFLDGDFDLLANIITVGGIPLGLWIQTNLEEIGVFLNESKADIGSGRTDIERVGSDRSSVKGGPPAKRSSIKGISPLKRMGLLKEGLQKGIRKFKDAPRRVKWLIGIGSVYILWWLHHWITTLMVVL